MCHFKCNFWGYHAQESWPESWPSPQTQDTVMTRVMNLQKLHHTQTPEDVTQNPREKCTNAQVKMKSWQDHVELKQDKQDLIEIAKGFKKGLERQPVYVHDEPKRETPQKQMDYLKNLNETRGAWDDKFNMLSSFFYFSPSTFTLVLCNLAMCILNLHMLSARNIQHTFV